MQVCAKCYGNQKRGFDSDKESWKRNIKKMVFELNFEKARFIRERAFQAKD